MHLITLTCLLLNHYYYHCHCFCYYLFKISFVFRIITDFENKPSPIPLFRSTPQENHIALDKLRAVSSFSFRASLNRPNGLNRSNKYSMTATMCTERSTSSHKLIWNGRRKESSRFLLWSFKGKNASAVLAKVAEAHWCYQCCTGHSLMKTADISRHYHWFPREMTYEKRLQKFHTDDLW